MIGMIQFQRPLALLTALMALSGVYIFLKTSNREGRILGVTRALFFVLLALGMSAPFMHDVRTVDGQKDVVLLEDGSRSADLIGNSSLNLKDADLERRTVLRGNNSRLASALGSELRSGQEYLLVSDGQTEEDLQKVLRKYRNENSTISVLKPDMASESSVHVSGPSTTVPGATTRFKANIRSTETGEVPVKVTIDNRTVFDSSITDSWSFNRTFEKEGTHRIEAEIQSEDRYGQNNKYYKTVKVREKPEILYIGQESDLSEKISQFYDITIAEEVPEDLSQYYAVISAKALNNDRISSFISRGNGYMYLGGYENTASYLPVEASNEEYDTESTRVVVAIETSSQAGSSIRDSKDLAYALVDQLPLNTKVAAFHYSQDVHIISELQTLAYNKESLLTKISSIESIAETRHGKGLQAAKQLADGEGNIVLFTDGNFFEEQRITKEEIKQNAFSEAEGMDVNLHIVGVGEDPNRDFLNELADRSGGDYYPSDDVWRLGFRFGAGGGTSAFKPLVVMDTNHFITRGVGLDTSVSIFDEVRPKRSADVLVSGPGKREFLTSWNYGLGRVAAFSGGQPKLSRVLSSDPGLVSRTASWTVGNPERKDDQWLQFSETEAPGNVEVTASYPAEGLSYSSQERYQGEISPEGFGFHSFGEGEYSYNYNSEIREIGYSDDNLQKIASSTGGEVYTTSRMEEISFEGSGSEQVSYRRPLSKFFIAAALVVLLSEVGYRKLNGKK